MVTTSNVQQDTGIGIVVELVEFSVDRFAFGGINFGDAAGVDIFELGKDFRGQRLAAAVGTGGVRLDPVVGVEDVGLPTNGEDGQFLGALVLQEGSPR